MILIYYIFSFYEQYIKKFNGNMPQNLWHVTFVSVRDKKWQDLDLSEYDVILHTAALVHKKEQPEMEMQYHDVNYMLTKELAEILQMVMDKYTFENVDHAWIKLCYYYDYLGPAN